VWLQEVLASSLVWDGRDSDNLPSWMSGSIYCSVADSGVLFSSIGLRDDRARAVLSLSMALGGSRCSKLSQRARGRTSRYLSTRSGVNATSSIAHANRLNQLNQLTSSACSSIDYTIEAIHNV